MTTLISERDVEAKFLQPLFNDTLGYPENSLEWAKPVKIRFGRERRTKEADLVVSHDKKPLIIVEAKKPTETVQSGIDQVDSYAFALQAPYSVVTNGKAFILRGYYSFNSRINIIEGDVEDLKKDGWKKLKDIISFANIIASLGDKKNEVKAPDEEKIQDYRRFFRSLHNTIRDREKLDPAACFDELSKLLFLKVAEEDWNEKHGGQAVLTPEKIEEWEKIGRGEGMAYVNKWFSNAVSELYPDVFEEGTKINLSVETIVDLLRQTKNFQVKNGEVDVKGRAFEEFLPTQLRGKGLGQFFTPRQIVNFMADMAEISIYDKVVDFTCGSGGFLIKAFEKMQRLVDELPDGTWKRLGVDREEFMSSIKEGQLHGIDAEPRAARTAKMNMIMWGDGRRVVRGNALDTKDFSGKDYEPVEYSPEVKDSGCSLILANPPFGIQEKDQTILSRYALGSKYIKRDSQKTELLFIEKGLRLLKPQGKMLIVLPQGILSNDSYSDVRDLIHSEAEIRAIISLPTHTFVQSGVQTVKTCVLYLQKYTAEKKAIYDDASKDKSPEEVRVMLRDMEDFNYSIFMATAEFIGYEPSGRSIVKNGEQTDLDLILDDFKVQMNIDKPDMDLLEFAKLHYDEKPLRKVDQTVRGTTKGLKTSFVVQMKDTEERLDPPFYFLKIQGGSIIDRFKPLKGQVDEVKDRFRPKSDEEMDGEYAILSVTNDGQVSLNEHRKGEDFTQSYKRVRAGDIAYNPYRVNIGSIGVVPDDLNGGFVSPAYVVFRSKTLNPQFLVDLLRSPFYKMYLDVISTGSIRDSINFDLLETVRIPDVSPEEQQEILKKLRNAERNLEGLIKKIVKEKEESIEVLHELIQYSDSNPRHKEDFDALLERAAQGFGTDDQT